LQRLVESWGIESLKKKKSNNPYIPRFLRFLRKMLLAHPKTKSIFNGQTRWIFKHHRVLWLDETKEKELFGSKHTRWVWCSQG